MEFFDADGVKLGRSCAKALGGPYGSQIELIGGASCVPIAYVDIYSWSPFEVDNLSYSKVPLPACGSTPPDCSGAQPSANLIWPPNHKFVLITVTGVIDPDGDEVSISIDSIFQDEAVDATGSGNTAPDGRIIGATAEVRSERVGGKKAPGDGRVYHIGFTADDGKGGVCSAEVSVGVPHDQRGGVPVDGGALFDSTGLSP